MQRNLHTLIQEQSQQLKVMLDYQKERTKLEKTPYTELEATVPKWWVNCFDKVTLFS